RSCPLAGPAWVWLRAAGRRLGHALLQPQQDEVVLWICLPPAAKATGPAERTAARGPLDLLGIVDDRYAETEALAAKERPSHEMRASLCGAQTIGQHQLHGVG